MSLQYDEIIPLVESCVKQFMRIRGAKFCRQHDPDELVNVVLAAGNVQELSDIRLVSGRVKYDLIDWMRSFNGRFRAKTKEFVDVLASARGDVHALSLKSLSPCNSCLELVQCVKHPWRTCDYPERHTYACRGRLARRGFVRTCSLDGHMVRDEDGMANVGDWLRSDDAGLLTIDEVDRLERMIEGWSRRDRTIIKLRASGVRMKDIGAELGLSESRISQILAACCRRLIARMRAGV